MNFIVRIFKNSNYLSRATISTSIAAYFSLDTSFAWSWLYYNKIYDVIDFHQGDIFFSLSIPLGISKLETSRKEEKRKRKEDLSKTSFSISRPKIGDSSLPSPLLFSRKARDKEQWREREGVTVPRPPPTWLRHERKLRAKQPLSPGCYLYYSRHPGCHHCFDVPPPSPPNDHHAANRQNEPIIAAFVIFPWPPTTPSCSPPPAGRTARTRIVIVFPICIDWIPRSSPAGFLSFERRVSFCRCPELRSLLTGCFFQGVPAEERFVTGERRTIRNGTDTVAGSSRFCVLDGWLCFCLCELLDRSLNGFTGVTYIILYVKIFLY